MSLELFLLIGCGSGVVASVLYIRVLRRRCRTMAFALAEHERRESRRAATCARIGHDLDQECSCRRCLTVRHDDEPVDTRRGALRSELVNPDADPGALHLDSNFQPDCDYGLTQTVYEEVVTWRCARCGHQHTTTREYAVEDERQ